jgi:hypothetical protein
MCSSYFSVLSFAERLIRDAQSKMVDHRVAEDMVLCSRNTRNQMMFNRKPNLL